MRRPAAFQFLFLFLLAVSILLPGCGGGGGSDVGQQPTAAAPQFASIELNQALLRSVPSNVTDQRFTGFDSAGTVRYGPKTLPKAGQVTLTSVSTSVTRLQIEYLAGTELTGIGSMEVTLVPGQTLVIDDPPFLDVTAGLREIAVTPASPSIAAGTSQQFTALGAFDDGSNVNLTTAVTWSSSAPGVAAVDSGGLALGASAGTTTITAELDGVTGSAALTVTSAALSSVVVSPASPLLAKGTTQQLTAAANFTDGTQQDVTNQAAWTSGTPAVATVDPAGLVRAVASGQSVVTATLNGVSGTSTVSVSAAVATGIQVTPASQAIADGTALQYTAVATFSDASTQDVTSAATWSSSNTAVATIAPGGLATAVDPGGPTTIQAAFGGQSGSTDLTVSAASIASIAVTPDAPLTHLGLTRQLTATATLTDGSTQDVTATATWTSGSPAVATVDAAGLVSALAEGQTVVTATVAGVSGTSTISVSGAIVTGIQVTPANQAIADGTALQYTALATFSDASTQDVTSAATWSSSNTAVATIAPGGLATAVDPGGPTTIQAAFGGQSGSTDLTVSAASIASMAVTPEASVTGEGLTRQLTATATLTDGTTQDVTATAAWSSSDVGVATIDGSGLATAVSLGQTRMTGTVGGVSGSTLFNVVPLQPVDLAPGAHTYDTDSGLLDGQSVGAPLDARSFTLQAGATLDLTGTAPFILNSPGNVDIAGVINAAGQDGSPGGGDRPGGAGGSAGPGGFAGGAGGGTNINARNGEDGQGPGAGGGGQNDQGGTGDSAGGGGAGHSVAGSPGSRTGGPTVAGAGGVAYAIDQTGGSGGGGGAYEDDSPFGDPGPEDDGGGGGGGGGGVVYIRCFGTLTVSGDINVQGGRGGASNAGTGAAGGGGGSGGLIELLAPLMPTVTGNLLVGGGAGGAGEISSANGGAGAAGRVVTGTI